jgi:putative oxidoreductase
MNVVIKLFNAASGLFDRLWAASWIPALFTRLFVGYFFMETGWAKIHNLDSFAMRFAEWGIPHPAFNAALSAYTEFLGGALTIAGLGMRFVSIPMVINMIVAILSVKLKSVGGLDDFVELDEPLYALTFVWLFFSGAGWLSLDGLLKQLSVPGFDMTNRRLQSVLRRPNYIKFSLVKILIVGALIHQLDPKICSEASASVPVLHSYQGKTRSRRNFFARSLSSAA